MAEPRRVVVVGGGVAGAAAALAAAAEGAWVTLLARAPGATALYSGAIEMAPDLEVLRSLPHHPLNRLGMGESRLAAELEEAAALFGSALRRAGLELAGDSRTRRAYADLGGLPREANLVPATVAGGELEGLRGRKVLVVGIPAVSEYDAAATAAALRDLAGVEAQPVECAEDGIGPGGSITDLFGRRAPRPADRADAIAYPPGFTDLPEGGFELLAAAPSPHGWRLQLALERALPAAGVEVVKARVDGFDVAGEAIAAARAGERVFAADAFVLATGRFIGGGLAKGALGQTRGVREPLLDLTVFYEGRPAADAARELRHLEYLSPEPAFRAGLLADPRLRPLDATGRPPYRNLRAAGAVLGGRDYADGFGFGVPLLTGRLAGRWSARE